MEMADFQAVFEQSTALELIMDTDLTIVAASNAFLEATKSNRNSIVGKNLFEAFPDNPDNSSSNGEALIRASLNHVLTRKETHSLPVTRYDIITADSTKEYEPKYWKPIHIPVFDELNTMKYIIQRVEDITDTMLLAQQLEQEKIALKKVMESESYFRQLADIMPAKISNSDAQGNVIFFNKQWLDYTALTFDELKAFGYHNIMHPDELEEFQQRLVKAAETGKVLEMEMRFKNRKGEYKWHLNLASPIKDENGKVIMWVGSTTEIHDQVLHKEELERAVKERTKQLEEANKALVVQNKEKAERAAELEETVKERTGELRKSNEDLQNINADLDNFVYTASHDLKAPVSNIEGLLYYLETKIPFDNPVVTEIIDKMKQSIVRFKNTIVDLSEIAKIQAGDLNDREKLRFKDITSSVMEDIQNLVTEANAVILEDYSGAEEISFSTKNLRSVLYNLLTNAVKYRSNDRNPVVQLKTYLENDYIVLTVQDNGLGIKEEDKDKVFTIYKRLHTHVEGTGIGMSIVKRIIDSAGGKIEIESKLNEGTTFKIYFRKE
jgi:PAS domain S-box-containing protein